MDNKGQDNSDKLEQKLKRTTKRIQKTRKNTKLSEKEAAEFEEIRNLLDDIEKDPDARRTEEIPPLDALEDSIERNTIPFSTPWLTVFNEDLLFSLFNEETICLSNFAENEDSRRFLGEVDFMGSEEGFRELISSRLIETLIPDNSEWSPTLSLYVLYLMSVHQNREFVGICLDFLKFRPIKIRAEDVVTIIRNFGAKIEDWVPWMFHEERLLRKFHRSDGNIDKISKRLPFPFYNVEMVGRILIDYVRQDLLEITDDVKYLVRVFGRLVLDKRIRSGCLTPIYSTLLTVVCLKLFEGGVVGVNEIADLLNFPDLNPMLRSEICRTVIKSANSDFHDFFVLKTIAELLNCEDVIRPRPISIEDIKFILQRCKKRRETTPLEFYSIFQLIASSLPGITATTEDSMELDAILTQLDRRISQTDDSVDLIRLKREIAKVRNLVANNTAADTRFTYKA